MMHRLLRRGVVNGGFPARVLPQGAAQDAREQGEQLLQIQRPGPAALHIVRLPGRPHLHLLRLLHHPPTRSPRHHAHSWRLLYRRCRFQRRCPQPRHPHHRQDLAWLRRWLCQPGRSSVPVGDRAGQNPRRPQRPVPAKHHPRHSLRFPRQLWHRIHPWGWRLSLSLAGIPAALLTVSALFMVDTPNSLIERGRPEAGKAVLKRIRGTSNVDREFDEIVEASRVARNVKHPFRSLLRRRNRPLFAITVLLQMFQQMTGISAIMFYAPVLFTTLGFKTEASLYSAVITGAVNALSTLVSVYTVDRVGRRMLLLDAGVQMFLSLVAMAVVMRIKVTDHSDSLDRDWAIMVVVIICNFVSSFAWSWGPLGWLIPSETFPLETRSAGQSISVCANLLFTFVFAQAFLSMLCCLKHFIFVRLCSHHVDLRPAVPPRDEEGTHRGDG